MLSGWQSHYNDNNHHITKWSIIKSINTGLVPVGIIWLYSQAGLVIRLRLFPRWPSRQNMCRSRTPPSRIQCCRIRPPPFVLQRT